MEHSALNITSKKQGPGKERHSICKSKQKEEKREEKRTADVHMLYSLEFNMLCRANIWYDEFVEEREVGGERLRCRSEREEEVKRRDEMIEFYDDPSTRETYVVFSPLVSFSLPSSRLSTSGEAGEQSRNYTVLLCCFFQNQTTQYLHEAGFPSRPSQTFDSRLLVSLLLPSLSCTSHH